VFNGEVYNYLELHSLLTRHGWPCRSRCDTEAILNAYRVWGEACVSRLEGMFAWCLLDVGHGTAWFCRDRLGIKPLYMTRPRGGGLMFASEVRTLLAAGPSLLPPDINPRALESFFAQGAVCGPECIIAGVELVAPGQSLVTDWSGRPVRTRTYWRIPFAPPEEDAPPRDKTVSRLADTLRNSMRKHLRADVPLGLFLSGGIDSGALAAVASESAGSRLQTISVGFDQPEFDETDAAATVARALGTDHRTLRLTGTDVLDALPAALAAVDQPTVDGFNTYFVAQAARRDGLKVALSGLGGDELFGGYASFRDVPRALRWRRRLRWLGPAPKLVAGLLGRPAGRGGAKTAELFARPMGPLHPYLLRRELFLPGDRRALHQLPPNCDPCSGMPFAQVEALVRRARGLDPINQVSLFETSVYMGQMLLRDADVFSMAHGLELRVPLLDHRVVELAAGLPGVFKRPDPRPKPLLLDAVGPRLPSAVYGRPKQGFTLPWAAWLRGALHARARAVVDQDDLWASLGLNPAGPRGLWQRFERGDRRVAPTQIVGLLVLADFTARHGLRSVA
jgi:asparagine synthase (glutamine-hydrolysing)